MSDVPIIPVRWVAGLNVVDIGDLRVARGKARRPYTACKHLQLVYDAQERRIFCTDCEADIHAFDAFTSIVERYSGALDRLSEREAQVNQAETFAVRSRAAKAMDEAWRSRTKYPCCPHCRRGISPHDVATRLAMVGQEIENARRRKKKEPSP